MVNNAVKTVLFFTILISFFISSNLLSKAANLRYMDMPKAEVNQKLEKAKEYPIDEKITYLSSFFIGTPYGHDPLGEGSQSKGDKDPLFRLDKVDCLTFLEQIWGMLWSDNLDDAQKITQQIRYKDGQIAYKNRHHLMWSQWLNENQKKGYIEDITNKIIPKAAILERKTYTKHTCGGKWKDFCDKLAENMPEGKFSHYILPLGKLKNNLDKIPHGVFAFVVMKNRIWLPYRIKHSGLVLLNDKGVPILRHASTHHKKVVDVPLVRYIEMLQTKSKNWQPSGFIFVKPQRPALKSEKITDQSDR